MCSSSTPALKVGRLISIEGEGYSVMKVIEPSNKYGRKVYCVRKNSTGVLTEVKRKSTWCDDVFFTKKYNEEMLGVYTRRKAEDPNYYQVDKRIEECKNTLDISNQIIAEVESKYGKI